MHILFFTPAFPPFIGGGERYARSLALALAACGQQITIVTSQAQSEEQLWKGTGAAAVSTQSDGPLTVIRCPIRPIPGGWRGLLAWRKAMVLLSMLPGDQTPLLERMARRVPPLADLEVALGRLATAPHLIHGFNLSWEHALLAGRDTARRLQRPLAITPFTHFGAGSRARVARNATMDHQRRLLQEADVVLTLTTVERDGFEAWNIHPRRVVVAGGGVDDPPRGRAQPGDLPISSPFALFLGRATHDKGAIHAAQATLRLLQQGVTSNLVVAGRVAADFERFFARLDARSRAHIHLLGTVDEATKHALLQAATMLLLPSQAESFGIVILEAWRHATPVIGARAGGIPGLIVDGENGLLVPFGDVAALANAMQRLFAQPALRQSLGQNGQAKLRREYTWERVAERALAAYQEVAA